MRRRTTLIETFVYSLLLCVGGCFHPPTAMEVASADYGPFPIHYEDIIARFMSTTLKDPSSAQYASWKGPSQYWHSLFGTRVFGWRVCVSINAKNSYGGYVGFTPYFFMIQHGTVARVVASDASIHRDIVADACGP